MDKKNSKVENISFKVHLIGIECTGKHSPPIKSGPFFLKGIIKMGTFGVPIPDGLLVFLQGLRFFNHCR